MANVNRPAVTVPSRDGISAVRASYVHLATPYAGISGGTPKFQITCMFNKQDPADMAAVQQLANDLEACRVEQFPNEATRPQIPLVAAQPGQGPKSPIKDGDVAVDSNGRPIKERNPEYAGHYVVAASSKNPVPVVGPDSGIFDARMCKSGYWYKVSMNAYAYSGNGGGVTVGLNGAQFMREDVVLGGGGPPVSEMFAATGGQTPDMYAAAPQAGQAVNTAPFAPAAQEIAPPAQPMGQPAPGFQAPQQQVQQPAPAFPAPGVFAGVNPAPAFPAPGVQPAPAFQQPAPAFQASPQPLQQPGSIV